MAFGGLVVAWAVGYFGPQLWESAREARQDPLAVIVLRDHQFDSSIKADHLGQVIVPAPLSQLPPAPSDEEQPGDESEQIKMERRGWTFSAHEVDAMTTAVRLVVAGTRSGPVTINRVAVQVIARRDPVRGLHVPLFDGGGLGAARYIHADLDSGAVSWSDQRRRPLPPLALVVRRGEQEILDIIAITHECDCDWVLNLHYTVGDEQSVARVPSQGQFRTSALTRAARWEWLANVSPVCKDFVDLTPTMCDALPQHLSGKVRLVTRRTMASNPRNGWGLAPARSSRLAFN